MNRASDRWIMSLIAISMLAFTAATCLADGGEEGPDDRTTKSSRLYPNSQAVPGQPLVRVTNDGLGKIKEFYKKTLGPYDLIRDFESGKDFRQGFAVVYRVRYRGQSGGEPFEFATVEVSMPDSVEFKTKVRGSGYIIPEPFTALQRLVGQYGHTQADYDKIFAQYQWLRYIQYWDPASDGPAIPNKYHEKVFGPAPKTAPGEKKGDQAVKNDLEKKQKEMQALNESGDIAAMVALAQEMQQEVSQTEAGQQAGEMIQQQLAGLQKDSWNDWLKCLQEMAAAARWVKLDYSAVGNWWGTDFWKQ